MSNLEHYFENLLFSGKDVNGDFNKNSLTKEEQNAVEICANYVLYTLFCGRDDMKEVLKLHEVNLEEYEFLVAFVRWLRNEGFGEEQFQEIMNTYLNDKGRVN